MPPDLGQRYTAIRPLGEGGQGSVWLAVDSLWGRQVAVKLLRGTREQPRLLHREFAVLGRLTHAGLAMVHDLGLSPAGHAFLVSEYVDAQPLGQWWEGRGRREVLAAVARLLGTLDFLHRRELVHRDVKPANVKLAASLTGATILAQEVITNPKDAAFCMCNYDLSATVNNLPAGNYTVKVLDADGKLVDTVAITVP